MGKHMLLTATIVCFGCGTESVEDYNKKLKDRAPNKESAAKVIKVETAVPGGTKIPCTKLFDVAKMAEELEEKDPVTLSEHTQEEFDSTAVCSVRRGGKVLSAKEQEKRSKDTNKLGVLAGDELCNIAVYCSIPADEEALRQKCKNDNMDSNDAIGVFACVKVTPKGPDDAYTYKFVDPDSRCTMRVRGGPSVNEESEVRKCARAALVLLGPESLQ